MFDYIIIVVMWACTIGLACIFVRVWWTAVRTGRWLKGRGNPRYSPRPPNTFTVYDQIENPMLFGIGVTLVPATFLFFLLCTLMATAGFVDQLSLKH
jgi:hypothetical protein